MSENTNLQAEEFLAAATAGLKHDRELQLDVQAELRSHLEDRQHEAAAAGLGADAAAEEAVRAMGVVADIASDLERANRRRLRVRAVLRLAAQWLLVPLAVVVALLMTDWGTFRVVGIMNMLGGYSATFGQSMPAVRPGLTPEQRLVLSGDLTRSTRLEQQRAIWEKWPDSKVYLHNYVTYLLSRAQGTDGAAEERYTVLAEEIAKLQPLDPDNARFDYLLAGRLLDLAVEMKPRQVTGPDGKPKTEYDVVIKNRAKLDEAMARFKAGLAKPEFRRYTRELSTERLAIMGEPTSLLQEVSEIAVLAGILLPDLGQLRNLERGAAFYGELLAKEGRRAEADVFLNAYRRLVPHLNADSFTLIDVLVVGAVAGVAADRVPAIYESLGDAAVAARVRSETAALSAPVKQWREANRAAQTTPVGQAATNSIRRHGGILAGLLLPALGEYPTPAELAPSRHLEYVVAEGLGLGVSTVGLVVLMLILGLMACYYRWWRGGGANALVLLPEAGEILRILGCGVLVPLLLYYAVTRWLPWGGRELSLHCSWPQFAAQFLAVLSVILLVTPTLADNCVRRRCRQLLLPVAPPARCFSWGSAALLLLLALLPAAWLDTERSYVPALSAGVAGLVLLLGVADQVYAVVCDRRHGKACAAYYGSLSRTLIPIVALTLILVTVGSRPYLRMEERRLLKNDAVMHVDPQGGFTVIESRVTQRLKAETQKAIDALPR